MMQRLAETRYSIITPARNEEQFIETTLKSVASQTVVPMEWIIVNDGSTDGTKELVLKYATNYPWIRLIDRPRHGPRQRGGAVVEAFYAGYNALTSFPLDFLVKLDADLSFAPWFFEKLFRKFADRPRLGIAGGVIESLHGGRWVIEHVPARHVRGATKVYRWACWVDIGGLVPNLGWDGIDELKAQMLGWETRSFPELRVFHYRPTGAAGGGWRSGIEQGRAAYFTGSDPLFLIGRAVLKMFRRPYLFEGMGIIVGYLSSMLHQVERINDPELIGYLRKQQRRRMLLWRQ